MTAAGRSGSAVKRRNKMSRVPQITRDKLQGDALKAWDSQKKNNNLTNMKEVLLQDYPTYDAFMAWYTSWNRLVQVVGVTDATFYAHAISTTNSCMLCSLFFISDIRELGLDPENLELNERQQVLVELGQQIVKDPTAVSDELFDRLRKFFTDPEIVAVVGFGAQMIATNNFNSVLQINIDDRLLPIKDQFKPATWRNSSK